MNEIHDPGAMKQRALAVPLRLGVQKRWGYYSLLEGIRDFITYFFVQKFFYIRSLACKT